MGPTGNLSPMFRQYRSLKQQYADAILLFRMGDFYEMFYEDAKTASRLLDITLTARGKGTDNVAPMCGFPHHQLEGYTARLVGAGQRVAICEQLEDPKQARGLVRRDVVRVVTPGTVTDPSQLDAKENAWIAGFAVCSGAVGAAFLDASTGEFLAWQSPEGDEPWAALASQLDAFGPREIVYPEGLPWSESFRREQTEGSALSEQEPYGFTPTSAGRLLMDHLAVASLDGFGLRDRPAAIAAAGGLLLYLQETQKNGLEHIDRISFTSRRATCCSTRRPGATSSSSARSATGAARARWCKRSTRRSRRAAAACCGAGSAPRCAIPRRSRSGSTRSRSS